MNKSLDALDPRLKPKACELIARCIERGIMVLIVNTLRTQEEQDAAVASGHSKVKRSKHQDGLAIDICPVSQYYIHGTRKLQWDISDPVWKEIGQIGQALGLRWGGTFKPLNRYGIGWDPGHFEFIE